MRWVKEKPTTDGYYWFRRYQYGHNSVCTVRKGVARWAFELESVPLAELDGEWWGPLREPDASEDGRSYDPKPVSLPPAATRPEDAYD